MLKRNFVTELKNAFDGLISRIDMANKEISELEDISVATFKTKKKREQRLKNTRAGYSDCGTTTRSVTNVQWGYQ